MVTARTHIYAILVVGAVIVIVSTIAIVVII